MKVIVNGEQKVLDGEQTIAQILEMLCVPQPGTAVAINGAIVPRNEHDGRAISDGDRIDILRPIGGG